MSIIPIDEFVNTGLEDSMTPFESSSSIKGHFHNEYDTLGLQQSFDSSDPWYECRSTDVESLQEDSKVTINVLATSETLSLKIKKILPDGIGLSIVQLYKY